MPKGRPNRTRAAIIPIGPSIAYIPLTRGQFALVDREDANELQNWLWCAKWRPNRSKYVAVRAKKIDGCLREIPMYRHLLKIESTEIDHINRCPLDNRKANLRFATRSQNEANKSPSARNTSGYKGVSWNAKNRKWYASIYIAGRSKNLGHFADKDEAARVYDMTAKKEYGEFAYANF